MKTEKKEATKLTDKELKLFIKVLGAYRTKMLCVEDKIKLSKEQFDYLCSIPNE